jgi:4-hydroxy-3-polyprenylbenzoate decarboxylase
LSSYIVAITGASGAVYGLRLIGEILSRGEGVDLVISPAGFLLLAEEAGIEVFAEGSDVVSAVSSFLKKKYKCELKGSLTYYRYDDIAAPIASGSVLKKKMIVCPASMGTIARIAAGVSGNLIERAADCVIKEGGKLTLVPRETPLSPIHLENMLKLSRIGVSIVPAMPAFYSTPESIEDMVDFVVGKTLDSLSVENNLYKRWSGK